MATKQLIFRAPTTTRAIRSRSTAVYAAASLPGGPKPPYNVLITGSSRGVGRALAEQFLKAGDNVVITSRDESKIREEVEKLTSEYGAGRAVGIPCNVANPQDVRQLADGAKAALGSIDLWICNAGSNAYYYGPFIEAKDEDIAEIVSTNTLGVMYSCKEAIRVMKDQQTGGHIWVMDGAGADGNPTPRFAVYGATKRGLEQFTKSLRSELEAFGVKNVGVHNLSPGMVTTELLLSGANSSKAANFFINCLAEPAETVAQFLVPRVREVPLTKPSMGGGVANGTYIRFLTQQKALGNIAKRLLTGARKGRYLPEDGAGTPPGGGKGRGVGGEAKA